MRERERGNASESARERRRDGARETDEEGRPWDRTDAENGDRSIGPTSTERAREKHIAGEAASARERENATATAALRGPTALYMGPRYVRGDRPPSCDPSVYNRAQQRAPATRSVHSIPRHGCLPVYTYIQTYTYVHRCTHTRPHYISRNRAGVRWRREERSGLYVRYTASPSSEPRAYVHVRGRENVHHPRRAKPTHTRNTHTKHARMCAYTRAVRTHAPCARAYVPCVYTTSR